MSEETSERERNTPQKSSILRNILPPRPMTWGAVILKNFIECIIISSSWDGRLPLIHCHQGRLKLLQTASKPSKGTTRGSCGLSVRPHTRAWAHPSTEGPRGSRSSSTRHLGSRPSVPPAHPSSPFLCALVGEVLSPLREELAAPAPLRIFSADVANDCSRRPSPSHRSSLCSCKLQR